MLVVHRVKGERNGGRRRGHRRGRAVVAAVGIDRMAAC